MSITRDELAINLCEKWKKYMVTEGNDIIEISISSKNFTGPTAEHFINIILKLEEDGRYLKVIAPGLYSLKSVDDRQIIAALHKKLLQMCWETKLVQFEFNNEELEIRGIVEIAIEDGTLTALQLQRAVKTLHEVVDHYHPEITEILSGKSDAQAMAITQKKQESYSKIFNSRLDQALRR
jgi:hypothetical protein